jgi:hypothetical protein
VWGGRAFVVVVVVMVCRCAGGDATQRDRLYLDGREIGAGGQVNVERF